MIPISPFNLRTGSNTEKKQQPIWISIAPDARYPWSPKYQVMYLVTLSYHYVFLAHCGLQAMPIQQVQPAKNIFLSMVIYCYNQQRFQIFLQ